MVEIKLFFKVVCPCFFGHIDDEVPLMNDAIESTDSQMNYSLNERETQSVETPNSRKSSKRTFNNSRYRKNEVKRDDETERALNEILDRTRDRMININEFREEINFDKFRSMIDNEKYMEEINAHDRLSKDIIKQDCLLEPTINDDNLIELLTKANGLSIEESEDMKKMLSCFNDKLKTVSAFEFDEPLVVYMDL
uniref:RPOL4c domain-containing protein n=1 Tax=Strongyloides papillosus TaxID=174720 RepID=A0A0N5BVL4_STREA